MKFWRWYEARFGGLPVDMFCVIHDASSAVLLPFKVLLWLLDGEKPLRGDCTKTFYNGRSETEGTILKGVQVQNG